VGFILFISCHSMGYHMTKWDCTSYDNSLLRGSVQSLGILLSTKIIVLGHHIIGPHGGRRDRLIGYGLTDRYLTSATSIPESFNWSPRGCWARLKPAVCEQSLKPPNTRDQETTINRFFEVGINEYAVHDSLHH